MYSFGAMLSFTVAHASIVALRARFPDDELLFRARPSVRIRGVDWPLFAILGGLATGLAWLVVVVQEEATRWAGLGWLVLGFSIYIVYRKRVVHEPLASTVRAPAALRTGTRAGVPAAARPRAAGPGVGRCVRRRREPRRGEGSPDRRRQCDRDSARAPALTTETVELEVLAHRELDEARRIGDSYGVGVIPRLLRGRSAGAEIVGEAARRGTEIIVIGAPRKDIGRRKRAVFGETVDYVLKNAPCRVMVTASSGEA